MIEPSPLEEHLGYWLRCLSNFVHHSFAERLARYDVSVAQWVVLRVLYSHEHLTLNEAAAFVGVDKSALSRMVERLVQKKLLLRLPGEDRRSVRLELSPLGRELVPKLAQEADENDRSFFRTLKPEQRQLLLEFVHDLLKVNGWDASVRGQDRMD